MSRLEIARVDHALVRTRPARQPNETLTGVAGASSSSSTRMTVNARPDVASGHGGRPPPRFLEDTILNYHAMSPSRRDSAANRVKMAAVLFRQILFLDSQLGLAVVL